MRREAVLHPLFLAVLAHWQMKIDCVFLATFQYRANPVPDSLKQQINSLRNTCSGLRQWHRSNAQANEYAIESEAADDYERDIRPSKPRRHAHGRGFRTATYRLSGEGRLKLQHRYLPAEPGR